MTDSIDEGEFIDLCEQCGKWDQDNHLCQPNNGEYTTVEWKAILETRKRVALRQARLVIQERRAQIEAEENNLRELEAENRRKQQQGLLEKLEKKSRNLLFEIEKFLDQIRMVLRIPQGEHDSIPEREAKRDEGLIKFKRDLGRIRHETKEFCDEWNMNNEIGKVRDIHDEIEKVRYIHDDIEMYCDIIENLEPWHPPYQRKGGKCICIDYPSMQCPLHPGRN